MELEGPLYRLALALGIGLLIGLERGWRTRDAEPGSRAAGIRTFAISGLLGGVIAALSTFAGGAESLGGGIVLGAGFASFAVVIAMFGREENRASGTSSATTVVAAMLTFALGAYAYLGDVRIAGATAVAAAGLLAIREEIHGWVARITWPELRSLFVLLAMTFIALPIVPDTPIGPYGGVNPREVWVIAVVLAGVSFLGYVFVKYFDVRLGLLLAAFAGGIISSTAVTIFNARRAAAGDGPPRLLTAGVAVASAVMFLRVFAIIAVLKPELLMLVAPALVCAAVFAGGFGVVAAYGFQSDSYPKNSAQFRNPFDFFSVVGFALLLAAVIVFGRAVSENLGASAAIVGAAVIGLADVDSVTVSITRLVPQSLSPVAAAYAVIAAVATDTLSKIGIGAVIGHGRFAAEIAAMALGCFLIGGAALWITITYFAP